MRISGPERHHAWFDDERERAVHALTEQLSPPMLEGLLRSLGDHGTRLVDLPPTLAALSFRDSALELMRSRTLGADDLRAAVSGLPGPARTPAVLRPRRCYDRALFVFGLRRGGNHAITEWLRGHFADAEIRYLNSAEISLFETGDEWLTVDRDKYAQIPLDGRERVLVVGYENLAPARFPLEHNGRVAERADVVVVLRDFPNTAASIARQARDDPSFAYRYRIRDFLDLWRRYADYFENRAFGFTYVSFNHWFRSLEERRRLSGLLGLRHCDRGVNEVSAHGGGSSFEGLQHSGRAQAMLVLDRWRAMLHDPLFQFLVLADDEALEVNARLFDISLTHSEVLARWRAGEVDA